MVDVHDLHFRPTIVICVDQQGMETGDQLALMFEALAPVCLPAVTLLGVRADEGGHLLANWYEPGRRGITRPTPSATTAFEATAPLTTMIVRALAGNAERPGVIAKTVTRAIELAGYTVPIDTITVWVVGAATSSLLAQVCAEVRAVMKGQHVTWPTVFLALLNIYPEDASEHATQQQACQSQPWKNLLLGEDGQRPLANYAYVFERRDENGFIWANDGDVPFAAAEAIFVLTATPIIATNQFDASVHPPQPFMITEVYQRMGGIGTSRLVFPRAHAEAYCADLLAAEVIDVWAKAGAAIGAGTGDLEATRWADGLMERMTDSNILIDSMQGNARRRSRTKLDEERILGHFKKSQVKRRIDRYTDLAEALEQQSRRAAQGFDAWKGDIRSLWTQFSDEAERQVTQRTNELLLDGPSGVAKARAYVATLNKHLGGKRDTLVGSYHQLKADFDEKFRQFAERARGPWAVDAQPGAASASGAASGEYSRAQAQGSQRNEPEDSELRDDTDQQPAPPAANDVSDELPEQETFNRLAARHRHLVKEVNRPTPAAVAGAAAVVVPPATLVVQSLLPEPWHSSALSLPAIFVLVSLVALVSGWAYIVHQARELSAAEQDLYDAHKTVWRYEILKHELARREAVLVIVHAQVRLRLRRLGRWSDFVQGMSSGLYEEAEQIEDQLLGHAIARRDILVANKKLLCRPDEKLNRPGYTLSQFYHDLDELRSQAGNDPAKRWHASAATILPHLQRRLADIDLLVESQHTIVERIRQICCDDLTRPYLAGELVSLAAALKVIKPRRAHIGLFDDLLEGCRILLHPDDVPQAPLVFVAARDDNWQALQDNAQARAAIPTRVKDDEWFAALRFWPHGASPSFLASGQSLTNPLGSSPMWSVSQPGTWGRSQGS